MVVPTRFVALVFAVVVACSCGGGAPPPWAVSPASVETSPGSVAVALPPAGAEPVADDLAGPAGGEPVALASVGGPFPVFTDPGEVPEMRVPSDQDKPLPLTATRVRARLTGFIAEVEVAQTWQNTHSRPIEAKYVFPLPENAAVYRMRMAIGERVIESTVQERGAAARTYQRARQSGQAAALLEQERPNVFTQSVANIEPGRPIEVVIRYVQDLSYDAGEYEFVFPMVVGPRFVQPGLVADAARVTPPVLGKGERSGNDVSLEVVVDGAMAPADAKVPTHDVSARRAPDGTLSIALTEKRTLPNRDFVMRYRVAEERPRATMLLSGASDGFFSLVVQPPALDVEQLVGRREILFVVDVSGSMRGAPLGLCKAAMREALARLRPVDTFNVITFAGSTGKAFERSAPANASTVGRALAFVGGMTAGGGTHMLDAVSAALGSDVPDGRHRYVFFLTDGYVAVEDQIMARTRQFVSALEARGRRARVFGFGVGASPNRALLDGLSREGKGATVYASNREDPARAVNHFYRYIDSSVLRDVRVVFGALEAAEVVPRTMPDLFASRPLVVHGRFRGEPRTPVVVRATSARGPVEIPVTVAAPPKREARGVLGTLWARARIGELEGDLAAGDGRAAAEMTRLGVSFQLATRFTSFVAVDRSRRSGDGAPPTVLVPTEQPEGTELDRDNKRSAEEQAGRLEADVTTTGSKQEAREDVSEGMVSPADAPPPAERGARGCFCGIGPGADGPATPLAAAWAMAALATALGARRLRPRRRRALPPP